MSDFANAEFPLDGDGRTLHLFIRKGDLAPRIVTVGSTQRAEMFATYLDAGSLTLDLVSPRGFRCFTGAYKGVPISVVASLMGSANMDFFVREARATVDGPMAIIRFGTCGGISAEVDLGNVVVSNSAVFIQRDYDANGYRFTQPVPAHPQLRDLLVKSIPKEVTVRIGESASADSFYAAQGRKECDFEDYNATVVEDLKRTYPGILNLEMEHFTLLHLAKVSKPEKKIYAATAALILAHRLRGEFLSKKKEVEAEELAAKACFQALVDFDLLHCQNIVA
eukprot:ANDGO_08471.mRNA.1 Purine nucleoside phosphorylase